MRDKIRCALAALAALVVVAGCNASSSRDPPLLVPWSRVGDIALGESRSRVVREYGSQRGYPQPFYRLHGGKVWVDYDEKSRVSDIGFTTAYYRTKNGFGVRSRIPLGPCHRSAAMPCEHRWHGFVWNEWVREKPCSCWVKVGLGAQSLPVTADNFLKPWFFINVRHGHVTEFYFALKFVD